jgi:hypothetical protein
VAAERVERGLAPQVLADGHELHLGGDDAAPRVVHLRHAAARPGAQGLAAQPGELFEPALLAPARVLLCPDRQVAVVLRLHRAALVLFDVAAPDDPLAAQSGQPVAHVAAHRGVAPRPARVVDAHGRVLLHAPVEVARRVLRDFAQRHAHRRHAPALDVNLARVRQPHFVAPLLINCLTHDFPELSGPFYGPKRKTAPAGMKGRNGLPGVSPFGGTNRIRFKGSPDFGLWIADCGLKNN